MTQLQVPACDRCTQGVMDATNPHYLGTCECSCHSSAPTPVCGFCKGEPVGNAASWVDGKPRPPAPCPRCGVTWSNG